MWKTNWKKSLVKNVGFLFDGRENVLNSFKTNLLPIKNPDKIQTPESKPQPLTELAPDPTHYPTRVPTPKPTKKYKHKLSSLKLSENFVNEIEKDEENISNEVIRK